ncbi:hypothetical protein [Frigoribacterium sp. UYMn621]|uniref:hypothetical protein n=1 Tax=Frigoribacterium sp. UYMn621 TaxID=3156343 RepID=UPI003399EFAB
MMDNPVLDIWNSQPPFLRQEALEVGEQLVTRIEGYGAAIGVPLDESESSMLRRPMTDMFQKLEQIALTHSPEEYEAATAHLRDPMAATVRRAVPLVRGAITADKANHGTVIKARRGLTLPEYWSHAYDLIYDTELPWLLSYVLQKAFMGCGELGETKPWTSK